MAYFAVLLTGLLWVLADTIVARQIAKRGTVKTLKWLKLSQGYDPRMGIPKEYLKAMTEAAEEVGVIAIFRANKPKAIPLLLQGAHGKPMWAKFKTSHETGVLTAKNADETLIAYQNGAFVVHPELVSKRMARRVYVRDGLQVIEDIPLKKLDKWTVESGQVVKADGIPIVGDGDLLGVVPKHSHGSNVSLVPEDILYGDWNNPLTRKFAAAVNSRTRQKFVLHGAQDQYGGDVAFRGLTDDTAYAVWGDGYNYVMKGKEAQEEFYRALGRLPKSKEPPPIGIPGWQSEGNRLYE